LKNILIVDDNVLNVTILLETLRDIYDICVALDGEDAIEAVEDHAPDLIILDIFMGSMSGLDVCKIIKSNSATSHIPVIFLTATDDVYKGMAYSAGADDFMTKPFAPDELKIKIKRLLDV